MIVAVIGAGHVGLVAAACFADFGLDVLCIDSDSVKIAKLRKNELPFYEPGLRDLVEKNSNAGRLTFTTDLEDSVKRSEVIFIAVGTEGSDGCISLDAVYSAADQLAMLIEEYKVIVIKSTVPVGTAAAVALRIQERLERTVDFDMVSNPEFLREGSAVENFLRPDRVILGASTRRALAVMEQIYRPLYLIETPIVGTTNETAELIKFLANAFLAMKISFINEAANLADSFGCDVHVIAHALGMDRRIGPKFLHPGPGYGGSCLPKDTRTLLKLGRERGITMNLLQGAIQTNQEQPAMIVAKVRNHLGSLEGRRIGVLGLSYKPNTDDTRESPAIRVCQALLKEGASIQAHDPLANDNASLSLSSEKVTFWKDPDGAAKGMDALVVLTEWNEFRNLDLKKIRSVLRGSLLVDARNLYDPLKARGEGFVYEGMGRTMVPASASVATKYGSQKLRSTQS